MRMSREGGGGEGLCGGRGGKAANVGRGGSLAKGGREGCEGGWLNLKCW